MQVLEALAWVLHLHVLEQEYLLGLAAARPKAQRRRKPERVPARLPVERTVPDSRARHDVRGLEGGTIGQDARSNVPLEPGA